MSKCVPASAATAASDVPASTPAARRCRQRVRAGRRRDGRWPRPRRRRADPFGRGGHLGGDPGQLLLAPRVGLLEVDRRCRGTSASTARTGRGRHASRSRGLRQQLVAQEAGEPLVRRGRRRGGRGRGRRAGRPAARPRRRRPRREAGEEPVRADVAGALVDGRLDLAPGATPARARPRAQRRDVPGDRPGQGAASGRRPPSRRRCGRHEVEDVADHLDRRDDDVQVGLVLPARALPRPLEVDAQRGDRHPVGVVDGLGRRRARPACGGAGRRGAAHQSGEKSGSGSSAPRIPRCVAAIGSRATEVVQVAVGDGVDGGGGASGSRSLLVRLRGWCESACYAPVRAHIRYLDIKRNRLASTPGGEQ